ncbi:unnamed protein product [Effrenium voratum]|nr:unnamed protein product [Effrenium voratum]
MPSQARSPPDPAMRDVPAVAAHRPMVVPGKANLEQNIPMPAWRGTQRRHRAKGRGRAGGAALTVTGAYKTYCLWYCRPCWDDWLVRYKQWFSEDGAVSEESLSSSSSTSAAPMVRQLQ